MKPGLNTQEQKDAAKKWVDDGIKKALSDIQSPPDKTKFATLEDYQNALVAMQANPYFQKVKEIVDFAGTDTVKRDAALAKLQKDSLEAMENGKPRKGFFEIFKEAFKDFSILNPIGSIVTAFKTTVKEMALSYGGDLIGPWLKAQKSKIFDGKAMTTEQASRNLSFQNAAAALAPILGISGEDASKAFSFNVAGQLDAVADAPAAAPGESKPAPTPAVTVLKPGVVTPALKTNGAATSVSDMLAPYLDNEGVLEKALREKPDAMVVMENGRGGRPNAFYIGRKEGNEFVVESMIRLTPDNKLAKAQTGLKRLKVGDGNTVDDAGLKAVREDAAWPRIPVSGNILPLETAIAGTDGGTPELIRPALAELDKSGAVATAMNAVKEKGKTPEVMLVLDERKFGAYVGYREGNDFVVETLVMPKPAGVDQLMAAETGLPTKKFALEGNKISISTRDALLKDLGERRQADGKLVPKLDPEVEIPKEKANIQAQASRWAKDVLGMNEGDIATYATAKAGTMVAVSAMPRDAELAELQGRTQKLTLIVNAGAGLRGRFDVLQKLKMGVAADDNSRQADIDKAWKEYVTTVAERKPEAKPVKLNDVESVSLDQITQLSAEIEKEISDRKAAAEMKAMADKGKVFEGGNFDTDISVDAKLLLGRMPAEALTELKGKKYIAAAEGGKTAIYIGQDVTEVDGEDPKMVFRVERVVQLKDGAWTDNGKPAADISLSYAEDGSIDADGLSRLKEMTGKLARVDADMAPGKEMNDPFAVFKDAVALAASRFPPGDGAPRTASTELKVEVPGVPDLLRGGISKA